LNQCCGGHVSTFSSEDVDLSAERVSALETTVGCDVCHFNWEALVGGELGACEGRERI